jgi:hypothetical protein
MIVNPWWPRVRVEVAARRAVHPIVIAKIRDISITSAAIAASRGRLATIAAKPPQSGPSCELQ